MTIQITSSAFIQGHPIPKKYTGEGADVRRRWAGRGFRRGPRNWR